jgi:hypothetical protein
VLPAVAASLAGLLGPLRGSDLEFLGGSSGIDRATSCRFRYTSGGMPNCRRRSTRPGASRTTRCTPGPPPEGDRLKPTSFPTADFSHGYPTPSSGPF